MHGIEQIEKHLPDKRKMLLRSLRTHNWDVVSVDDDNVDDWALDQRWLIESTRENKGVRLTLWFFKYDGLEDGLDRVVPSIDHSANPGAYVGEPSIEFGLRKFEKQLHQFIDELH